MSAASVRSAVSASPLDLARSAETAGSSHTSPSAPLLPLVTIDDWLRAYRQGGARPAELIPRWMASWPEADPAWITRADASFLSPLLTHLESADPSSLPLYGVPFAVKDNIDVAGLPTTAACPAFSFRPDRHATVISQLLAAGAVPIGKTNLDQFATGLVGTRSPYGAVPNTFNPAYVSGGSSSGSASVVARGLVPFALGTDTAGSGRVPAGLNNLVGLKPTPGSVPMRGVLPACRTIDVVSIFALTVADAARVASAWRLEPDEVRFNAAQAQPVWLQGTGKTLRVGVPATPDCDAALGYDRAFERAVDRAASLGWEVVATDMAALFEVAQLLYDGPWVAERYTVIESLLRSNPAAIDSVVRGVVERARGFSAADAFRARYRLAELQSRLRGLWQDVDVLMVPTTPGCPTLAEVASDPVGRNSALGRYTNFVNLLGFAALALPCGMSRSGLPFGITLIGAGGSDAALAELGAQWEMHETTPLGRTLAARAAGAPHHSGLTDRSTLTQSAVLTNDYGRAADAAFKQGRVTTQDRCITQGAMAAQPSIRLAVVGAHLAGLPLHGQLVERGCRFVERTRTAPHYRLYAIPGSVPPKPGLVRVESGGASIEIELYDMPQSGVGSFLAGIAYPLGLGSLELESGTWVHGFTCDPSALSSAPDITDHGGWRAWLKSALT